MLFKNLVFKQSKWFKTGAPLCSKYDVLFNEKGGRGKIKLYLTLANLKKTIYLPYIGKETLYLSKYFYVNIWKDYCTSTNMDKKKMDPWQHRHPVWWYTVSQGWKLLVLWWMKEKTYHSYINSIGKAEN